MISEHVNTPTTDKNMTSWPKFNAIRKVNLQIAYTTNPNATQFLSTSLPLPIVSSDVYKRLFPNTLIYSLDGCVLTAIEVII